MNASLTPLQRAFLALQEAEGRATALQAEAKAPIAIVGLGCRAPGGVIDADSFWKLLSEGRDAVRPPPRERWDHDALYDPDPETPGRIAARCGGFIEDIDRFDADFFRLSPREVEGMDPQQRLFLEVCWEALENAGQAPDRLHGSSTGVFVGAAGSDYAYMQMKSGDPTVFGPHFASGIAHSVLSGRVSYLLGLQGPSITIDTACSSSLVAIHLACQALRNRECRLALAGGVNLILTPDIYIALSRARMLAPDGLCKAFDAAADGFGRGEGAAVVALKRLSDAQEDGDRILAVIRGSAVNQDGPSSGLTAPNGPAQEAVIRAALAQADLSPRQVGYVEAHGTGTELGDPLEAQALGAVFAADRPAGQPLLISSVKANIGHLEAAAGAIGLVKLVLSLQHKTIPAHPHFKTPSSHIAWDEWKLSVPDKAVRWPELDGRFIGGISSFGFSGTNAHIVLEAAAALTDQSDDLSRGWLFPLSAHRQDALHELAVATRDAIGPEARLADVARTLTLGRANLAHRAVLRAESVAGLRTGLDALSRGDDVPGGGATQVIGGDPPRIAFLFTGQGAQYAGMAAGLYAAAPAFREAFNRCDEILTPLLGRSLRNLVLEATDAKTLEQTGLAQPALFSVEYAIAEFLRSVGVVPVAVMGHSVGEYVGACVAGALDLRDALSLIVARGSLMQSLPTGGAMAAVFAPESRVIAALAPFAADVSIAAVNGPAQTVISGAAESVQTLCDTFASQGVKTHRLPVSHAFHSPLVAPILDAFEAEAAKVSFRAPDIRIISNLTGKPLAASEIKSPAYWRRHLREGVRFADGLRSLADMKIDVCIEIGPHPALSGFAATVFDETSGPHFVSTLRRGSDDWQSMLDTVGRLYLAGAEIDWRGLDPDRRGRPVALPTARFQRQRYWFAPKTTAVPQASGKSTGHPLLGVRLRSPLAETVQFEAYLTPAAAPFIADHVVQQRVIMPAAGMIDMALRAGLLAGEEIVHVENFLIAEPLVFTADVPRTLQTIVRRMAGRVTSFEVLSCDPADEESGWLSHAQGDYVFGGAAATASPTQDSAGADQSIAGEDFREMLRQRGLTFGPSLGGVKSIRWKDGEAFGDIVTPDSAGNGNFAIHPAQLDACLQIIAAALPKDDDSTFLPIGIDRIQFSRSPGRNVQAHAILRQRQPSLIRADVMIRDAAGEVCRLEGISLRPARGEASSDLYKVEWRPVEIRDDSATWMPQPAELRQAFNGRIAALAHEYDFDTYQNSFLDLERASARWIVRAFETLGWWPVAGERISAGVLAERLKVIPRYHRLLGRLLDILAEDGILSAETDGFTVATWPTRPAPPDEFTFSHSGQARTILTVTCGTDLAEILTGRIDPLHRLFPGGSSEIAERLYRDSPESKAYNRLLGEVIARAVESAPAGRPVRILEVGGGTGGSTVHIISQLASDRVQYCFTDVGPSLVERARTSFGSYPFMTFRQFDLEGDPGAKGLTAESFDIIVAANVVHATKDLRQTLGKLRTLLAPGGSLCLMEVTGFERWIDLTFGLTEGWWHFTDLDLRRDYPLIDRAKWIKVLTECGFDAQEIGAAIPTSREALLIARRPLEERFPRRIAVLGDGAGLGAALAERIKTSGGEALVLNPAATPVLDGHFDTVVHLGFLDRPSLIGNKDRAVLENQRAALSPLLAAIKVLGSAGGHAPRLCVVTSGASAVTGVDIANPAQATSIGFRRAVALEHPEWRPMLVDLDPAVPADVQVDRLLKHLFANGPETEIALRGEHTFVSRLARVTTAHEPAPVQLQPSASGVLSDLRLVPQTRRKPGPGQIEIRITASGLNFRDVMNALAMRDDPEPLGGECAGVVAAVGEGVAGFSAGDAVVATVAGTFGSYVLADVRCVAHKPRGFTDAQIAALPLVAMTARHALQELAKLRAGQTILIHSAAGGVGLAAVQIARRAGAKIFATAGSEAKRDLLFSLGAAHVFPSRSLEFKQEILALTGGKGVDVVLNSLSGPFIAASVDVLSEDGIFLEIGKRDIWSAAEFRVARPRGHYHVIDLSITRLEDPSRWGKMLHELMGEVASGVFQPLPVRTFPISHAADAFAFMAHARHVGKIVLTESEETGHGIDDIDRDGIYLVTGAFSGLGLETAQRLVQRGARRLALVGRSLAGPEAQVAIGKWRASGVEVLEFRADAGNPDELVSVFARIDATGYPLRGVIHSAGALSDGVLLHQDWDRFSTPLHAKVTGAWALHLLTRDRQLDFFILYSSVAATFGSAGQANHAAANAFMDALAQYRRAIGLPALSIGWGAWSGIGAAAIRGVDETAATKGIGAITPEKGMALLEVLSAGAPAHVVVSPMDWPRYLGTLAGRVPAFLSDFSAAVNQRKQAIVHDRREISTDPFLRELESAPLSARRGLLVDFVCREVAGVLGRRGENDLDPRRPLNEMGLDSLLAVELRNRLGAGLALSSGLPATLVFDCPTIEALAAHLEQRFAPPVSEDRGSVVSDSQSALKSIDNMSDDEIDALFDRMART